MTRYVVGWERPSDVPNGENYGDDHQIVEIGAIVDDDPIFTGLYDAEGRPLFRIDRIPLGFCR